MMCEICEFLSLKKGFKKTCDSKKCIKERWSLIRTGHIVTNETRKLISEYQRNNKPSISLKTRKKLSSGMKKYIKENPKVFKKWRDLGHNLEVRDKAVKSFNDTMYKLYNSDLSEKNYFLYLAFDSEKLVKIGRTNNIEVRIRNLKYIYNKNIIVIEIYHRNYNEICKLEINISNIMSF